MSKTALEELPPGRTDLTCGWSFELTKHAPGNWGCVLYKAEGAAIASASGFTRHLALVKAISKVFSRGQTWPQEVADALESLAARAMALGIREQIERGRP